MCKAWGLILGARMFIVLGILCGGFGMGCTGLYYMGRAELINRRLATALYSVAGEP